jgi:cyclin-dependent kinase-like
MAREIKILKEYRHANIVNLKQLFRERGKLHLVFDYEQRNLLEEL